MKLSWFIQKGMMLMAILLGMGIYYQLKLANNGYNSLFTA